MITNKHGILIFALLPFFPWKLVEVVLNWALIKIFIQYEPLVARDLIFIQWLSLDKDVRVSVVDCEIEVSFT